MNTLLDGEMKGCFDYFYENFSREQLSYGLMPDKLPESRFGCSIAANGFMLAAMAVGADYGYIPREEAERICRGALQTCARLEHREGFFYHFYDLETAKRLHRCELSLIDTALFLAGALTAGAYFGGQTLSLARALYERCNWQYFYDGGRAMFRMAEYDSGFSGHWDVYAEQLLVYFLAAGSEKGRQIAKPAYDGFNRLYGSYAGGREYIFTWFGSLFTHQFSHAFIDFEGYRDEKGVDWFENSVVATLENRRFCLLHAAEHRGYAEGWGLTSCMTERGYTGRIGVAPSGNGDSENLSDGTIAPCGALGSLPFTPEESLKALEHFLKVPSLNGRYGLKDAYNADTGWVYDGYISIDKGVTLLMAANYRRRLVWNSFCSLKEMREAYAILKFKKEHV